MCFVSNVSDFYGKKFEPLWPTQAVPSTNITWTPPSVDLSELKLLIDDFKQAMEAAKKLDVLMKQPDCVDPEKAKLEARVAELEAKLAEMKKVLGDE